VMFEGHRSNAAPLSVTAEVSSPVLSKQIALECPTRTRKDVGDVCHPSQYTVTWTCLTLTPEATLLMLHLAVHHLPRTAVCDRSPSDTLTQVQAIPKARPSTERAGS
jgi:hypothetical protein